METLTVTEAIEPAERAAFFAEMRRLRRRRASLVAALRRAEEAMEAYAKPNAPFFADAGGNLHGTRRGVQS